MRWSAPLRGRFRASQVVTVCRREAQWRRRFRHEDAAPAAEEIDRCSVQAAIEGSHCRVGRSPSRHVRCSTHAPDPLPSRIIVALERMFSSARLASPAVRDLLASFPDRPARPSCPFADQVSKICSIAGTLPRGMPPVLLGKTLAVSGGQGSSCGGVKGTLAGAGAMTSEQARAREAVVISD
jgi:hypothetical protein